MKKIILIFIALFLPAILVTYFYLSKTNKPDENKSGEIKTENTNYFTIENSISQKPEEIKTFSQYASERPSESSLASGIEEIEIKNRQGKKLSLSEFLSVSNSEIPPEISAFLSNEDYNIFFCPQKNGLSKDFGIIFNIDEISKINLNKNDIYGDAATKLRKWEPGMLRSLHKIIFPNTAFSDADLSRPLEFMDGESRFCEITLSSGEKISINYKNYGDPVAVSSSLECLETAYANLIDTGGY